MSKRCSAKNKNGKRCGAWAAAGLDKCALHSDPELAALVGNATDALRQLAKTEGVGVVALSQLARPRDRNPNSRPSMLGLKESGGIEAHAHVVL